MKLALLWCLQPEICSFNEPVYAARSLPSSEQCLYMPVELNTVE